uniref:Uncharacterized protein n=1 Tax=Cannabis sativa TaxID=3483 RepID=A0A803QGW4_CANSA
METAKIFLVVFLSVAILLVALTLFCRRRRHTWLGLGGGNSGGAPHDPHHHGGGGDPLGGGGHGGSMV